MVIEQEIGNADPDQPARYFTQPWVTKGKIELRPNAELWEYFCVPSESDEYNKRLVEAARTSGK